MPSGPFAGRRFRGDRHHAGRLWLEEVQSGRWDWCHLVACNQDGKTFLGLVCPTLYLLFERQETVILGVPSLDLVADKWRVDLLPTIKASRYADLLPKSGGGSRDGETVLIEFGNGARLRFMTAGGSDQARANFASPNLIVTELEGFDRVGGQSREGDKLRQLLRRTLAYGDRARVVSECTAGTEAGRTWRQYLAGTQSRVCLPCPHCGEFVTPERDHLTGWQGAASEREAADAARLCCPACGHVWSEDERVAANRRAVLCHRGQEIARDGSTTGNPPDTRIFTMRWTAANSTLSPGRLGRAAADEWAAKRAADEDAAETDLRQSQWALPAKPSKADVFGLVPDVIMARCPAGRPRGVCPPGTLAVTVGCDVGKRLCHWVALAWLPCATPHVIDYGVAEVPSDSMGIEAAVRVALSDWWDKAAAGWKWGEGTLPPAFALVDAGWKQDAVLAWAVAAGAGVMGSKSYGSGQRVEGRYKRDTGATVVAVGEAYNLVRLVDGRVYVEVDADRWKSWLHARLLTPVDKPGAMTLFSATSQGQHLTFAKHLTAERQTEEWKAGEGTVVKWEQVREANHYLDATALACVAGHAAGMRLVESPPPPATAPPVESQKSGWVPETENWLNR